MTALADGAGPPENTRPTFLFPLYPFMGGMIVQIGMFVNKIGPNY
jgi:hypothetical protein